MQSETASSKKTGWSTAISPAGATCSRTVPCPPDRVFAAVIDISRLPEWNDIMVRVVEPVPDLVVGSEWVVEFHAMGSTWRSRSRVESIDRGIRSFAYRSSTDDGNPSYALWSWKIDPDPAGSLVTVRWHLHPVTFWRRILLARIRSRQLTREIPASIAALGEFAKTA